MTGLLQRTRNIRDNWREKRNVITELKADEIALDYFEDLKTIICLEERIVSKESVANLNITSAKNINFTSDFKINFGVAKHVRSGMGGVSGLFSSVKGQTKFSVEEKLIHHRRNGRYGDQFHNLYRKYDIDKKIEEQDDDDDYDDYEMLDLI